ncbi:hypothetical protein [Micromonospora inositola]|uniref:Uncharacterized protein n=1 Tax=Micromonospora inositola TaxID=47865 RepID=A0A1C5K1A3_9ACTN|nr:hypothetical protein [Micromonospora inositola]SCG76604.1 hypothetical protein GA0070613_6040 [Micromonospora inositola]
MRLPEVLALHLSGVREVVDASREGVDLAGRYHLPADVRHRRCAIADAGALVGTPDRLLVGLLGPKPSVHLNPREVAEALTAAAPGTRAVLLLAWPVDQLPAHLLVGPLVAARCQIVDAIPLSTAGIRGVSAALIAQRVDRPLPPRGHLVDMTVERRAAHPLPEPVDELRTMLRMANEHQLTGLVTRSVRRRLQALEDEVEQQRRVIAERDDRLAALEGELAALRGGEAPGTGQPPAGEPSEGFFGPAGRPK